VTALPRLATTDTTGLLRAGVLALGAVATAGTAVELATERHWNSAVQLVPWCALVVLAIALGLLAVRPNRRAVTVARVLGVLVVLTAIVGIAEHVQANLDAGILNGAYSATWQSLPLTTKLWLAATKTVGPAPPLAPGVLAQAALLTLLATWRHPALSTQS
jgi:hypothetical protein